MSDFPLKLASLNMTNGVDIKCGSIVKKIKRGNNRHLIIVYNDQLTKECLFCIDTSPPDALSGIFMHPAHKTFIDVSFPDGHILSKSSNCLGRCIVLGKLQEFFIREGFGSLYVFKYVDNNRVILMSYSSGRESAKAAENSGKLPLRLFKALTTPINGAKIPLFTDLIFNGGITHYWTQAYGMFTKACRTNNQRFDKLNRFEKPYISTLADDELIANEDEQLDNIFCENEWVSMNSGYIFSALLTSLKATLKIYKKIKMI